MHKIKKYTYAFNRCKKDDEIIIKKKKYDSNSTFSSVFIFVCLVCL